MVTTCRLGARPGLARVKRSRTITRVLAENICKNKNAVNPGHPRAVGEESTNEKSLFRGTVGPSWPRSADGGYRPRENWGVKKSPVQIRRARRKCRSKAIFLTSPICAESLENVLRT
jgi:hypothetical protein